MQNRESLAVIQILRDAAAAGSPEAIALDAARALLERTLWTRTVQCFPSGKAYQVAGEWPDYEIQTRDAAGATFARPPRGEERLAILVEETALRLFNNDVLACQSSLVDDLIKGEGVEGFDTEDIRNLYPDPSAWTTERCRKWLDDNAASDTDGFALDFIFQQDDDYWRDAVRDRAEPAEVYEWWLVTNWLGAALAAEGEVLIDNGHGVWWGRCCTGQAVIMDGTLQRVAAALLEDRNG